MADDWVPPGEFEEYRLLRILGRGGMGSVWLAEDTLLQRSVAIKWIAHAEPSERQRQRFALEARAAARLQHVNVVTVYRYGEVGGRPYLVSEYIRGDSLDRLATPLGWERALELGVSLARGLAAAHRHGIVHRDIKPANAILSADGEVKLVDFGLARIDADPSSAPPPPAGISGTPAYMAPEARRGEPATRRSDVYQVGCILYELVIGRPPVLDDTANQTAEATVESSSRHDVAALDPLAVPSLGRRLGEAGAAFAAVIDRCLQTDPRDRFADGEELRDALERLRDVPTAESFDGNPYRGLVPFEAEHRAVFFGRAAEARAVCERLRADPFVLVAGDSGVGKSSLCRAAVLPWIADGRLGGGPWRVVRLVPGVRPMSALVAALASVLELDEARLSAVREEPAAIVRELRRAVSGGVVVFVDQLEELISLGERDEAVAAAALLAELAVGAPGLRLLATVRGDFLTRVAELPLLGGAMERAIFLLAPLTADGAREAITGPASATGVRFESKALVEELVAFVADPAQTRKVAALPLLAFTLAVLWEARDRATGVISAASLAAVGGARGALALHADGVLAQLLPAQRAAARRILVRLVAPGSTRARRSAGELTGGDRSFVAALEALVRGRLVVARGSGDDATYELAHEGLIDGWPALASLVSQTEHVRALQARVAPAVADWLRMGRAVDGLWSARQLDEIAAVPADELTADEAAFVRASRRALTRRRWLRRGAVALVPLVALSVYAGVEWAARRDLDARITRELREVDRMVEGARSLAAEHEQLRDVAFARFDAADSRAEADWSVARERGAEAGVAYARAARALEGVFLLDTSRTSVRRRLAELTFERLERADRHHDAAESSELTERLALYDPSGSLASRRSMPGVVDLAIEPADATITVDATPLTGTARLAPGTHVFEARAAGRASVRWPVRIEPASHQRVAFTLPLAEQVPTGMIYVPRGRFRFGSGDDEAMRAFLTTAPMHEIETGAYLIARTEVTYAAWIEFLDTLSDAERAQRAPHLDPTSTVQVDAELSLVRMPDNVYELRMSPARIAYRAVAGAPIVYRDRTKRASQDWRRFPVSGISSDDAVAFAQWLDRTGKVPRARLCNEREWERAARGVDGRPFPGGDAMAPDDANFDLTYDKRDGGYGIDEVGSHPGSTSVFGLADTAGNVWELTRSATSDAIIMRGGCYYTSRRTAHLANREEIPRAFRHLHAGLRICADAP